MQLCTTLAEPATPTACTAHQPSGSLLEIEAAERAIEVQIGGVDEQDHAIGLVGWCSINNL